MDEVLVLVEEAAKENAMKENEDTEEKETEENNLNNTGTPNSQSPQEMQTTTNTDGLSLFVVGGIRNKNKQKDRTNVITSLLMESKTEEEQEHGGDNNVTMNGNTDPVEHQGEQIEVEKPRMIKPEQRRRQRRIERKGKTRKRRDRK